MIWNLCFTWSFTYITQISYLGKNSKVLSKKWLFKDFNLKLLKAYSSSFPVSTHLLMNFIECLEEALKYVLLLNFDEEPRYDYLIEQFKTAYLNLMNE